MLAINLGAPELLIVLGIILLLFGAPRLPKLARSLGQASREFKQGVNENAEEDDTPRPDKPGERRTETSP
jgi:sec-independent protein translocase protein TatA